MPSSETEGHTIYTLPEPESDPDRCPDVTRGVIEYGDTTKVETEEALDTATIGGVPASDFRIGGALTIRSKWAIMGDGIIGFGPSQESWLGQAKEQGTIASPRLTFDLRTDINTISSVQIGYTDPALYTGEITWLKKVNPIDWVIDAGPLGKCLMDSGISRKIYLPRDAFLAYWAKVVVKAGISNMHALSYPGEKRIRK